MTDVTIEHIALALLAAIPASIAAVSSLRNNKEQKRVKDELARTNGHLTEIKKKLRGDIDDFNTASNPDWYHAPTLWP